MPGIYYVYVDVLHIIVYMEYDDTWYILGYTMYIHQTRTGYPSDWPGYTWYILIWNREL
jgi:hypothetical protein